MFCRPWIFPGLFASVLASMAMAVDAKQLSTAQALITRAEKLSSMTQTEGNPFFVQAEIIHTASPLSGSTGVYRLWWADNNKWREEADAENLRGVQIRAEGLWVSPDFNPKLSAIFADGQGYPFRGELLRWNEEIIGYRDHKADGISLSCVEVATPELQRELCFDSGTGLLRQTTSEVKLQRWQFIALEPDTSTPVRVVVGNTGDYVGQLPNPTTIEFVTKYADYTQVGNKFVPARIRHVVGGKTIVDWKLVRIAPDPKPPFDSQTFSVPEKYQPLAACDRYQPPSLKNDFWRQAPTIFSTSTLVGDAVWFTKAGKVADGVRITVGADGRPEEVALLNPIGKTSKAMEETFLHQTYEAASCDGKPVAGALIIDFSYPR